MGIPGLGRQLWQHSGCVIDVNISELARIHGKNVIVVDGFNFYGQYLYPECDWINGAFTDLVDDIRCFVDAFKRIGVKLVFFFVEGHLNAGQDWLGSSSWLQRSSEFIEYTNSFFETLVRRRNINHEIGRRPYYFTPLHVQSVVIFVLRRILNCEVHFRFEGDRCDATAYFARSNEHCLALLVQDYVYMFYEGIPCLLSLTKLNLRNMTTVQYCPDVFARCKDLEGTFYPFFLENAEKIARDQEESLKNICRTVDDCNNVEVARGKIMACLRGKSLHEMFNVNFDDIEESENINCKDFMYELLRFKYGFEYLTVSGPLQKWELIKLRAQELYTSGHLSNRITNILMTKKFFNDCILEDFTEFPPSSYIYQPLRKKIYGVLFFEEPDTENIESDTETCAVPSSTTEWFLQPGALNIMSRKKYGVSITELPPTEKVIREWCMRENGCPIEPELVIPDPIDPSLHPGLLTLWTFDNVLPEVQDMKWQLFANCISSTISSDDLKSLVPTLVVPTVVLHILNCDSNMILEPWEVEAFIVQAVMLPKWRRSIHKIRNRKINARVVKLIAIFVYGCHIVQLLNDTCGCPISENDICIYNFFDGKLLQLFYEKANSRHSTLQLCDDEESRFSFQKMKQLILSHN